MIGQVRVPPHQRVAVRLLDLQLRQEPRQPCQQPQVSCDWSAAAGLSSDWLQCGAACRDQLRVGGAAAVCGELRAEVTVASPGNTLLVQLTTGQGLEAVLFYSNKTQFISTLLHLVSLLKLPPLSPLELETKAIRRFAIRHYANQPLRTFVSATQFRVYIPWGQCAFSIVS